MADEPAGRAGQGAAAAPDLQDYPRRLFSFDSQALIQLIGGLVIGLIALYTSYDHINLVAEHRHLAELPDVFWASTSHSTRCH